MILQIGRNDNAKTQKRKNAITQNAFTLIELVMVAAIILLLVAVSTPLFIGTFKDLKLRDAAYNVSKMIQYAQQKAIMEEKKYSLLFDFERRAYRLLTEREKSEEDEFTTTAGDKSPLGGKWKEVTGRFGGYFYLPEGIKFKGEADKITFLPNGRCDKISLYITNKENKTFEIETNGRAGYVKVSEVKQK